MRCHDEEPRRPSWGLWLMAAGLLLALACPPPETCPPDSGCQYLDDEVSPASVAGDGR